MKASTAIAASVTAASVPSAATEINVVWTIAVPIVAAWFAFVGLGVLAEKSVRDIVRQVVGGACLGGVVGIVAWAAIEALQAQGIFAALVTLTLAVSPVLVFKTLTNAGPDLIGAAFSVLGFERKRPHDPPPGD